MYNWSSERSSVIGRSTTRPIFASPTMMCQVSSGEKPDRKRSLARIESKRPTRATAALVEDDQIERPFAHDLIGDADVAAGRSASGVAPLSRSSR